MNIIIGYSLLALIVLGQVVIAGIVFLVIDWYRKTFTKAQYDLLGKEIKR